MSKLSVCQPIISKAGEAFQAAFLFNLLPLSYWHDFSLGTMAVVFHTGWVWSEWI